MSTPFDKVTKSALVALCKLGGLSKSNVDAVLNSVERRFDCLPALAYSPRAESSRSLLERVFTLGNMMLVSMLMRYHGIYPAVMYTHTSMPDRTFTLALGNHVTVLERIEPSRVVDMWCLPVAVSEHGSGAVLVVTAVYDLDDSYRRALRHVDIAFTSVEVLRSIPAVPYTVQDVYFTDVGQRFTVDDIARLVEETKMKIRTRGEIANAVSDLLESAEEDMYRTLSDL